MPAPRPGRNGSARAVASGDLDRYPPARARSAATPRRALPDSIEISCPPATSETGAFRISWEGPEDAVFELRENGELIYRGVEGATTVTGRPAGVYEYTVEAAGAGSEPCVVEVAPPSLAFAFTLFGIGFVVFVCTLVLILRGHRATREEEGAA